MARLLLVGLATGTLACLHSAMAADIPLKLTTRGFAIVDLAINGDGPFPMVLDTGAGITTVTTKLAKELNLIKMGRMPQPVQLAGGAETVDLYTMGYVTLAGDNAPAPITIILDEPLSYIREARGILGMNVLSRFSVDIDQPGKRLILHDSGELPTAGDEWSRLAIDKRWDNFLIIDASVGGKKVKAVLDTGANQTIINDALGEQLGINAGAPGVTTGTIALVDAKSLKGEVQDILAGDAAWPQLNVQRAGLPLFKTLGLEDKPAMILGNDALKRVRLFVDYKDGQVFLTRPDIAPVVGER